ncbi:Maleylacetoacetate isomerase [Ramicandelaber brevisporus]|nr:Maleylacetoacetate isomerase [Ramicandelaber brevisporus]
MSNADSSAANPILYGYFRSSCTARVRIALELKGIAHEKKYVNLLKSDHLSPSYASDINPTQLVPSFQLPDGSIIIESLAILEYLEEAYPDTVKLLPENAADRARVRAICLFIAGDIQPIQNMGIMKYVGSTLAPNDPEAGYKWNNYWIGKRFVQLENLLKKTAGEYCFGDKVTLADVVLAPQVENAVRYGVDVKDFPTIQKVFDKIKVQDAFVKSNWRNQPDTPEELRA